MTVLVLVCIWHAIIPKIAADCGLELARTSDIVAFVLLASSFVAMHVVFVLWIRKRVSKMLVLFALTFRSSMAKRIGAVGVMYDISCAHKQEITQKAQK